MKTVDLSLVQYAQCCADGTCELCYVDLAIVSEWMWHNSVSAAAALICRNATFVINEAMNSFIADEYARAS